jgi:hypothetical protein
MKYIETIIESDKVHIRFELNFGDERQVKTFTLSKQIQEYEGVVLTDYLTQEQIDGLK